jgi:predicted DNA-binding transcriptional regulator YafY
MDASARLLRLLSLLQTPREWTGTELAERLEVSTRTVRNDIERLRSLGYPVHATRGSIGGYRLEAGAVIPPLLLEDDEAIASRSGCERRLVGRSAASRRPPFAPSPSSSRCFPSGSAAE